MESEGIGAVEISAIVTGFQILEQAMFLSSWRILEYIILTPINGLLYACTLSVTLLFATWWFFQLLGYGHFVQVDLIHALHAKNLRLSSPTSPGRVSE